MIVGGAVASTSSHSCYLEMMTLRAPQLSLKIVRRSPGVDGH
jgi:hypothetical protein